ncbi:hypothetical protein Misp03_04040 [Microbispora sp. NBRC 16548]|nr:hypothetical protein Misp03_04040 [Microbispora sp. NBRC 16548]
MPIVRLQSSGPVADLAGALGIDQVLESGALGGEVCRVGEFGPSRVRAGGFGAPHCGRTAIDSAESVTSTVMCGLSSWGS